MKKMDKHARTLVFCILTVFISIAAAGAQHKTAAPAAGPATQSSSPEAATIGVCDLATPKAPCIDQPFKGAKWIKGLGTKGDTITITVGGGSPVSLVVRDDGTFSVPVKALDEYQTVEVKETAAVSAIAGALVTIQPRPPIMCDAPLPCLQQPYEGDPQVSGKGKPGSRISLKIGKKDSGESCTVRSDGTFTVPLASPLSLGPGPIPIIEADESDPSTKKATTKTTTSVEVALKARPAVTCSAPLPCIEQPHEGDLQIAGKPATDPGGGKLPAGTQISIIIDNKLPARQTAPRDDGTFILFLDAPLTQPGTIAASQIAPPITGPPIVTKVQPVQICGKQSVLPCLDQPQEGATAVTGKAPPGAKIDIIINKGDATPAAVATDGTFSKPVNALSKYDTIEADQTSPAGTTGQVSVQAAAAAVQSMFTLGLAGVDIVSDPTSGPKQQYFAEFKLTAPVGSGHSDPLDAPLWLWFEPRIASIPMAQTSSLSSLTSTNGFVTGPGAPTTLGGITQSLELHGGLEVAVIKPREGILFGNTAIGVSLIGGFGVVTPFNTAQGSPEFDLGMIGPATAPATGTVANVTNLFSQFQNTPSLQSQYPQLYSALSACNTTTAPLEPTSCKYQHVAFVLPIRSRFERSWSMGLRLKTVYFGNDCNSININNKDDLTLRCQPQGVYPGTLDLTFGQDETVTGGRLHNFVATISANYPIPGVSWLRVFGTAYLGLTQNQNSPALDISPTQTFVSLSDPSVVLQPVQPANQDYFRIGFGVDIVQAIKILTGSSSSKAPATSTPSSSTTKSGGNT